MKLADRVQQRLDHLTKPKDSLGDLEKIALKLALIQQRPLPRIRRKGTIVFAGDHGVVKHNVSAFPQEVTIQMVLNFLRGGAAINVLSRYVGARVFIVDAGVNHDFGKTRGLIVNKTMNGTGDLYRDRAMPRAEAKRNVELGRKLALRLITKHRLDLVALGEMGIGNTTAATILIGAICDLPARTITGRGTGIDDARLRLKRRVVTTLLRRLRGVTDPYRLLEQAGGLEICQLAGAILAGAQRKVPVVIDGLICTAAALIAHRINPGVDRFLFAGHKSHEPGHIHALRRLGLKPILDLEMRLGEGTGAVLAMAVIEGAERIINEMATFDSAGVSGKS